MMKVKTLIKELQYIIEQDPEAANLEFHVEPRKSWKSWSLYPGFSRSYHRGKSWINWRTSR